MRCFIAIKIESQELKRLQTEFRELEGIKIVADFHLTLKFFRDISEGKVEEIKEKLKTIECKKFKVSLDKLGVFPSQDYIRVVWVSLVGNVKKLKEKIDEVLGSQDARFVSHITLGRVKFVKDRDKLLKKLKSLKVKKEEFLIDKFYFIKSQLTKEGPLYQEIGVFEFS